MRYICPIPGDLLYWVSAVHVGSGVLLCLKLLDHLRYVLAPSRWPLMISMASGWIPEAYVQRFHPGWYARLNEQTGPAAAPTSTPASPSPAVGPAGTGSRSTLGGGPGRPPPPPLATPAM